MEAVINGTLVISNRKRDELLNELRKRGFKAFPKVARAATEEAEEGDEEASASAGDYDYLLSMPMWNLTMEKVGVQGRECLAFSVSIRLPSMGCRSAS